MLLQHNMGFFWYKAAVEHIFTPCLSQPCILRPIWEDPGEHSDREKQNRWISSRSDFCMREEWLRDSCVPDMEPGYLFCLQSTRQKNNSWVQNHNFQGHNQQSSALRLFCVDTKRLGMLFRVPERLSVLTWPEAIALSIHSMIISTDLWGSKAKPKSIHSTEKSSHVLSWISHHWYVMRRWVLERKKWMKALFCRSWLKPSHFCQGCEANRWDFPFIPSGRVEHNVLSFCFGRISIFIVTIILHHQDLLASLCACFCFWDVDCLFGFFGGGEWGIIVSYLV